MADEDALPQCQCISPGRHFTITRPCQPDHYWPEQQALESQRSKGQAGTPSGALHLCNCNGTIVVSHVVAEVERLERSRVGEQLPQGLTRPNGEAHVLER